MDISKSAVFVQTNDATSNRIVVFGRGEGGSLASIATYETGGRGTGSPHLPSQVRSSSPTAYPGEPSSRMLLRA